MADTNTIEAVWSAFFAHMESVLEGSGNPAITDVLEGEVAFDEQAPPFVGLQLIDAEPEQRTGQNKVWQCRIKVRLVEVFSSGLLTATLLARVGTIEDAIEAFTKPDGVAGLEDAKWAYTYPHTPTHGNLMVAESVRNFTVVVARGAN